MNAIVDILNELLAAEQRALAPRLFESTVFVSRVSVKDALVAERLRRANLLHCERLAGLVVELGGAPAPRQPDVMTADLHYLELRFVLPRLIADHERLLARYRAAAAGLGADCRAAELVARVAADHERELAELNALREGASRSPAARAS